MQRIETFTTRFGARTMREHAFRNPSGCGEKGLPTDRVNGAIVLHARVDHGRWIVDCPCEGCNGAELAWGGGFFCCECRNGDHNGNLLAVKYPVERLQIERVLLKRPIENRNWHSGESVDDLIAENKEHGL
jgi:hypothetical protein